MLATQLRRHLVEGATERRQIALTASDRHLNVEISRRHLLRRVDQPPDRADEAVGVAQAEPDRREEDDRDDDREHDRECDLHRGADLLQEAIIGDPRFGLGGKIQCPAINETSDDEHPAIMGGQTQDRVQNLAFRRHETERFRVVGFCEILERRHGKSLDRDVVDPLDDGAVGFDQHRDGKTEKDRARLHELAKHGPIRVIEYTRAIEIGRHQRRFTRQRAALQVAVGVRDLDSVLHQAVGPSREPGIEAP